MMEFTDLKSQYAALRERIHARIDAVLEHGHYIMGPEVAELEQALASYTGARYCITVASGTEALLIALMACGIRPGDEVITTPFSFIATAEVIVLLGARPVFVDIRADTCNLDADLIEAAITARTRAIVPVSLYGQPAAMAHINAIAGQYGLTVIEDGAQSFGASYHGGRSGNLSAIGCTSFFPSKPLGCYGDGGAIFTSDPALATCMREIRVHGQSQRYIHTRLGVGGRMDTLQCAIVLAKLERFDWELAQRRRHAALYQELLSGKVGLLSQADGCRSAFGQYTVLVEQRPRVQAALKDAGIPSAVHYPLPIHLQPAYAHLAAPGLCPVASAQASRVLSLPMSADLDSGAIARIAATLAAAVAAPD